MDFAQLLNSSEASYTSAGYSVSKCFARSRSFPDSECNLQRIVDAREAGLASAPFKALPFNDEENSLKSVTGPRRAR